jgi:hypothetical protein
MFAQATLRLTLSSYRLTRNKNATTLRIRDAIRRGTEADFLICHIGKFRMVVELAESERESTCGISYADSALGIHPFGDTFLTVFHARISR